MATKSNNTSSRSIKSSGNSEHFISGEHQSENASTNAPHLKNASNQSLFESEQEPLLGRSTSGKPSHRGIAVQPQPITSASGAEEHAIDFESQFQRQLYGIHKKYRMFLHNSRWILNIFIIVNTVWLVMTLISDFFFNINIFRTNNRYCSFSDLTLIFISIIANSFNLWFNKLGLYSSLDYALNVTLCILTLLNLGLVYLISYTRRRIGFAGTFTYFWAAFSFFIGVVIDWYLLSYNSQLNKPFDQDREENRESHSTNNEFAASGKHTLTEWIYIGVRNIVKFVLLAFFVLFTLNTMLSAWDIHRVSRGTADLSAEAATYSAFHWVDDSHTYKLHIECYGNVFENQSSTDDGEKNQPILLFEHGGFDTGYLSANWIQELYHLNRVQRYCTYERPGYGLSDSAPAPISIAMVADALKYALLKEANIQGPFVTIGYDLGGLFTQVFTAKNVDVVEGMMLVESWHEDLLLKNYLKRLLPPSRDGHNDPDDVSWLPPEIARHNEFKIWWDGLWSCWGLKLQTSWLLAHHGSRERIFGRDMKYQGKFLRAKFLESVTSSLLSYKDVVNSKEKLLDVKLSVVTSREMVKKSPQWGNWQRELTKLSTKAREWKIVEGGHEVHKYGLGRQQTQDVLLRLIDEKEMH